MRGRRWQRFQPVGVSLDAKKTKTTGHAALVARSHTCADHVIQESGKGTFGKVFLAVDRGTNKEVAIKVVRRIRKYTEAAQIEANILNDVNAADPTGTYLCVRYYGSFYFRGHFCMVFEPLGPSLLEYVKANDYRPAPLYCIQAMADQLVTAVAFLHAMELVHTDLKLENILLVSRSPPVLTEKTTSSRKPGPVLAPPSTDIRRECGLPSTTAAVIALLRILYSRARRVCCWQAWSTFCSRGDVQCVSLFLNGHTFGDLRRPPCCHGARV